MLLFYFQLLINTIITIKLFYNLFFSAFLNQKCFMFYFNSYKINYTVHKI